MRDIQSEICRPIYKSVSRSQNIQVEIKKSGFRSRNIRQIKYGIKVKIYGIYGIKVKIYKPKYTSQNIQAGIYKSDHTSQINKQKYKSRNLEAGIYKSEYTSQKYTSRNI